MRTKIRVRLIQHGRTANRRPSAFCFLIDHIVAPAGTVFLVLGIGLAALRTGGAADYVFASGLLCHLVVWFDEWLMSTKDS